MAASLHQILAVLGAFSLLGVLYRFASFVHLYLRPSGFPRYQPRNGETAWALVTGSTAGIGKAFVGELASRGFNVILHGRSEEKLDGLQRELEAKYPMRKFRKLVGEASDTAIVSDTDFLQTFADCLPLKVLINNVGALSPPGHHALGTLEQFTPEQLSTNITINATFHTLLTKAVLPMLKASQPSLVLNIGSFADAGIPLLQTYAPSKAFLMVSTTQLGHEAAMEGWGVEFLGVRIMQVTGTQVVQLPPSFMVPDAAAWVKMALGRVGCGMPVVIPHWPQAVQETVREALPFWVQRKLFISISRDLRDGDANGTKGAAKRLRKKEL